MQLVILYGPPASGKLTVAEMLSEKTGYKLFHNHLTVDLLKQFLEFGTPEFFEINQRMKLSILEACAKQKSSSLIMTFVYDRKTDGPYIENINKICNDHGVDLRFVQLSCQKEEVLKRVTGASRKNFKKVTTPENLEKYLQKGDFFSEINGYSNLKIDNTNIEAVECADIIFSSLNN